jgi:hypothetical protein
MRPHATTPRLEMKMGIGRRMTTIALPHVTRCPGKTDLIAGMNGGAWRSINPAQMPILGIKSF